LLFVLLQLLLDFIVTNGRPFTLFVMDPFSEGGLLLSISEAR
jgi:hypothetical protein